MACNRRRGKRAGQRCCGYNMRYGHQGDVEVGLRQVARPTRNEVGLGYPILGYHGQIHTCRPLHDSTPIVGPCALDTAFRELRHASLWTGNTPAHGRTVRHHAPSHALQARSPAHASVCRAAMHGGYTPLITLWCYCGVSPRFALCPQRHTISSVRTPCLSMHHL